MSRLSDIDRHYGPLTVGVSRRSECMVSACFKAERDDHYVKESDSMIETDVNHLYLFAGRYALKLRLPCFMKTEVLYKRYCDTTLTGWTEHLTKKYGFTILDSSLVIYYGVQGDVSYRKTHYWSIPWLNYTLVKQELRNPDDSVYHTAVSNKSQHWKEWDDAIEGCAKTRFVVKDYDGEQVEVTGHIERLVFHRGIGAFRWLGYVTPNIDRKRLELRFKSEVGKDKGSWKGGMTGHSVDMRKGETTVDAMKRYCETPIYSKNGPSKLELISAETPVSEAYTQFKQEPV